MVKVSKPVNLNSFNCMDCGKNTSQSREYYMLKNNIWRSICPVDYRGMLCLTCVEKRLGRALVLSDFPFFDINEEVLRKLNLLPENCVMRRE